MIASVTGVGLTLLGIAGCGLRSRAPAGKPPAELIVSAAASLGPALLELQAEFHRQHPGVQVRFNLGSSGALQAQIARGAPVDVFISAAPAPMDALINSRHVDAAAVLHLAANRLVLIRPAQAAPASGPPATPDPASGWSDLGSDRVRRIAIGNPDHVPAGQYARAVLEHLGLWARVQGKLVFGEDVRQVLTYVERGEVDAGVVYRSDAARSERVRIVAAAPAGSHPPIVYPVAVVRESRHAASAAAFVQFLLGPAGQATLARHGLEPAS